MTLYFDTRVQNPEIASINTHAVPHSNLPLLAVASYSQEKGGFITLYDDQGESLQDFESSGHSVAQVTALSWHPERKWLAVGWENGELRVWPGDTGTNEFNTIVTPHRVPIMVLEWSQNGGRLVSADVAGTIVGWRIDSSNQLLIIFHHELKDPFAHIAFKISPPKPATDLSGLAKAAVAGDERALDIFSTWRPKTALPSAVTTQRDNHAFYIGTVNGLIFFVDIEGQCIKVLDTEGLSLLSLLHHETRDSLVVMTEELNIVHYSADPITGNLTELTRVKLSGKSDVARAENPICWAGGSTLAILIGELGIRCWDLHTGDTHVLSPLNSNTSNITSAQEICTSIAFCKNNGTLAAGTNLGTIYFWKMKRASESSEIMWSTCPDSCVVHGTVQQIAWGATLRSPLLVVNCIINVFILNQHAMCAAYNDGVCASQISSAQILLQIGEESHVLKTEIQVKDVAVNKDYVAVSSGKRISVYKFNNEDKLSLNTLFDFICDTEKLLIHKETLVILAPLVIQLRSIDGTIIQSLSTLPEEGAPITMDLTAQYLTVASFNGFLKIWNLGKREAKLCNKAIPASEVISDFAEIIEAKCNSNCRFVSITLAMANLMPSSFLYIWDMENDQLHEFDFAQSNDDNDEDDSLIGKCRGKLVTSHRWDTDDPRLLICRAQTPEIRDRKLLESANETESINVVLVSFFVSSDHGIVIQDVRSIEDRNCRLLGVQSPHIIVLNSELSSNRTSRVRRLLMKDFAELENCDEITKKAILDFSFYLSIANMDDAFKAIKTIKNETIWNSLAKMCVKTKQLNMAMLCLGHMKRARGARALRESMQDDSLSISAKAGVLAVDLGLYDDAERLFREAKRLDLVISLLEGRNKFEESIALGSSEYKIQEKTSYFNYAKTLEQEGKIDDAIEMYTRADCHRFQVPRMLLSRPRELLTYLNSSQDPDIKNWHAQYIESTGDMEGALRLYEEAHDILSMTRLLCFLGREDEACELVMKTNHAASAYHLAAHYESKNNISQAVHFYSIAKAYTNAIRLCKEHEMSEELWPLVMLAPHQLQIDIAKHYEENGQSEKAVLLYHRSGLLRRAIELAFKTQQYDALQIIALDINADSEPALIERCANYFIKNEQIEKAVDLLATGKNYIEALKLIEEHNLTLDEDLAEKMTVEKVENDIEREKLRISILEKIGEITFHQGNYHLATRKFTQAGNKLRAMKALLKSGDTEKICFFAQVSRQKEIYIMAGNYLQSLDWQNQPEVLRNIINFYSKGKAMDLLANFYVACAQVEIDEFQNYEKAVDALNQASKCLAKVIEPRDLDVHRRATDVVVNRIATIKQYLDIQKLFERGDTKAAMKKVRHLLDTQGPDLEQSVRRGDLFATVTQHFLDIGKPDEAQASIEELKKLVPGINLSYYFNDNQLKTLGYESNVERENSSDKDDGIEELLGG